MDGERLAAGDRIGGKYEVIGELARGGMAVVYEALHLDLGRSVALKVLRSELAREPGFVSRFSREARAAARLQSEHAARVLDVGTLAGSQTPYIVMEHLSGRDLRRELSARGPLPAEVAVGWILEACDAVAEAHARGIVHRDIKPANLFLAQRDDGSRRVKVLDFGIAKAKSEPRDAGVLTGTRDVFGSPRYMSPEQLRAAGHVDARSDVWALGVVLYELVCGVPPFSGGSVAEIAAAVLSGPAPPMPRADLPDALRVAVARCLEPDAARRFPSIAAMARALAPLGPPGSERLLAAVEGWSASGEAEGHVTVPCATPDEAPATENPSGGDVRPTPSPEPGLETDTNWGNDRDRRRTKRNLRAALAVFVGAGAAAAIVIALRAERGPGAQAGLGVVASSRVESLAVVGAVLPEVDSTPSANGDASAPLGKPTASAAARPRSKSAPARAGKGNPAAPPRSAYDDRE